MIILWIRNNKKGKKQDTAQPETASFQQHSDEMKQFSLGHPKLESTGARDILTPEGDVLATVHEVRMALNCQN